jgi:hypothetical protein
MKKNYTLFSIGLIALGINSLNAQCPTPTLVTATPSVICSGSTTSLNATAVGAGISWFTTPTGGSSIGTSSSAANFAISPTVTTTYYAESFSAGPSQTFSYTGTIQNYTVPAGVTSLIIQAKGAQGGFSTASAVTSGLGADITGSFTVTPGTVLKVLVGQFPSGTNGGGGGTFVTSLTNSPYVVAGGGGGSAAFYDSPNKHGQAGTAGAAGSGGGGVGGTAGNGGSIGASFASGAGGGLLTSGAAGWVTTSGGASFISGGAGGTGGAVGGFGGGGSGSGNVVGAGGGGYSGGGGGSNSAGNGGVGGGGGSFNGGTSQVNIGGINTGNGLVIITPNTTGCTSIARTPVTVLVNARPTVSVTSGTLCIGSSYTLNPSGANTYTFSSGSAIVSPTVNATYSVVGTSTAGCVSSNTAVATVSVNPLPVISANSGTVCAGNSFTILATGATSYTYSSGSVISPTATATYTITGTSSVGCVGNATTTITVNPRPTVTATTSNSLICLGGSALLTASSSATSYTWNTGATTSTVSVSPTVTTTYTVSSIGTNGCVGSGNVVVNVSPCTGIDELTSSFISVYPNPHTGSVNLVLPAELAQHAVIEMYDALGKLMLKHELTHELNTINMMDLPNGLYTYKVINQSQVVKVGKLVKQ